MTSKIYSAVLAGTAVLAVASGSTGAQAATAQAQARARVLSALTLTNTRALEFGGIVAGAAAADVTIDATGARTCGTGISCSGTVSSASFNITNGTGTELVAINAPAQVTLQSGGAGGPTMVADLAESTTSLQLTAGAGTFTVGGTLHVGANQAQGDYTGTFNVTADYQ